jgi:hypothetical protein
MTKTLFRRGDTVSITGTVRYSQDADDTSIYVTIGDDDFFSAPVAHLKLDKPMIEKGDRVSIGKNGEPFDVLMIEGDQFVGRSTLNQRLAVYGISTHDWQRVPPVDEIAEQAAGFATGAAPDLADAAHTPPAPVMDV